MRRERERRRGRHQSKLENGETERDRWEKREKKTTREKERKTQDKGNGIKDGWGKRTTGKRLVVWGKEVCGEKERRVSNGERDDDDV